MAKQNRNPPWSDLPQELLTTIADCLTSNPISIFTFRSICRSWQSSCPPLSNSPLFSPLLPLSIPFTLNQRSYSYIGYSISILSVTIIYALYRPLQLPQPEPEPGPGSSSLSPDAWILFVDEFTAGKPSIRKPFSNVSYFTPINFPNNVNLIDSNVRELGRFHNFSYSTYNDEHRECKLSKPRFCVTDVNKVVLFPNQIAAIALHEDGTLEMCRLDVGIIEWEIKHDGKGFRFDDIVEFKARVLGIDRRGRVYQINYHSSELTPFVAPISGGGGRRKRLVESLGRLYLVVRCYVDPGHNNKWNRLKVCGPDGVFKEEIKKIKFKVYEFNEEKKKWVEVSSLGDRSFSFGRNFAFSASPQELGSCVKNCILFTRHSFLSYSWNGDDYAGFKKCELDVAVCHLHEADHFGDIESYPGYSDSLWPPPSWIWSVDRFLYICFSGYPHYIEYDIRIAYANCNILLRSGRLINDEKWEIGIENMVGAPAARMLHRIGIVETAIEGILDKVPENYKTDVERADDPKPAVLKFVKVILKLKKLVIKFHEEEIAFKNKLQLDGLLEQAKTWSNVTTEETCGNPDNWKTSQACRESLLLLTLGMLRMDAHLFFIEELVTEVEMSLKSRLAPILTV